MNRSNNFRESIFVLKLSLPMNRIIAAILSLPLLVFGVSCAPTAPTTSSFLQNSSQLQLDGKVKRYVSPKLSEVKYKKVYIEPVVFQLEKAAFSEKQRTELSAYYMDELITAFGAQYEIVPQAASDAYIVRSAITGLNGANVVANAVLAVVAVPLDNGGASAESEILRGSNRERLYAESRSVVGGFTGKGSLTSKTFGYLSKTSHSKAALKTMAEDLVKALAPEAKTEG